MKKLLSVIDEFHNKIARYSFYLAGFLIFVIAVIVSYDVAMRYFFLKPTDWATDFSRYFLTYSVFLSAAWIYKLGGHVRITFLLKYLSDNICLIIEIVHSIIGFIVFSILTYVGIIVTLDNYVRNILIIRPTIVPKFLITIIIPFGSLLFAIFCLKKTLINIYKYNDKKKHRLNSIYGREGE